MTTINHITPDILLEDVAKQFEEWRTTRKKRSRIPDELWAKVIPLEKHYRRGKIAMALRVSYPRLKQGLSLVKSFSAPITLHECLPSPIFSMPTQSTTLTFSCKNGSTDTLTGLRDNDIAAAVSALLRG